jgi:hypothetical protein
MLVEFVISTLMINDFWEENLFLPKNAIPYNIVNVSS